jgi:hypothetical protein
MLSDSLFRIQFVNCWMLSSGQMFGHRELECRIKRLQEALESNGPFSSGLDLAISGEEKAIS